MTSEQSIYDMEVEIIASMLLICQRCDNLLSTGCYRCYCNYKAKPWVNENDVNSLKGVDGNNKPHQYVLSKKKQLLHPIRPHNSAQVDLLKTRDMGILFMYIAELLFANPTQAAAPAPYWCFHYRKTQQTEKHPSSHQSSSLELAEGQQQLLPC